MTFNDPKVVEALDWGVKAYDAQGGYRDYSTIASTWQGDEQFARGQVSMVGYEQWMLSSAVASVAPDLNFWITKVATSPFAALGGLVGGGGDDLQFIEFPAGSETLERAEQQKIESLAKALQERPTLRVEVIGAADLARDRDALALQKMTAEVHRRFTKGGTKNLQAVVSQEREFEFLSDLYAEKLGKQPTKREEVTGGKAVERVLTVDELRQQLIPAMPVEESELRLLAQGRAKTIREQLIAPGRLPEERVFLVESELIRSEGTQVRNRLNLAGN